MFGFEELTYMCDLESYSVVQIRETCQSTLWSLWWHVSVSFYGERGCRDERCPSNILAFGQKETRVYIGTDKLSVFQASSLHVTVVHRAMVVASGYAQQCLAWLNLPVQTAPLSYFWNEGIPSPGGQFTLIFRGFCTGFRGRSGKQCSALFNRFS